MDSQKFYRKTYQKMVFSSFIKNFESCFSEQTFHPKLSQKSVTVFLHVSQMPSNVSKRQLTEGLIQIKSEIFKHNQCYTGPPRETQQRQIYSRTFKKMELPIMQNAKLICFGYGMTQTDSVFVRWIDYIHNFILLTTFDGDL